MKQLRSKRAKLAAEDLLDHVGYNTEKYERCSALTLESWADHLMLRAIVWTQIEKENLELQERPDGTPLALRDRIWKPYQDPLIQMKIEQLHPEAISEHPGDRRIASLERLFVDFRATDEQILSEFSEWLRKKRGEKELISQQPQIPRKFTPADLGKWHEHRALACIDLEMFGLEIGVAMTDDMLAKRLFPEDPNPERIRKTVRPLAKWLMRAEVIEAMKLQAEFEGKLAKTAVTH
jgi:hypothetical protein